jgi:hypothetical protein
MLYRGIYWNILLWLERIIDINSNNSLSPLFKLRHFLTRELISIACNVNCAIIIDYKFGIFVTPTIDFEPLLFVSDGFVSFDLLSHEREAGS